MLTDNKYVVYEVTPLSSGKADRKLAAVFVIKDGGFHLLEDYLNILAPLNIKDGAPMDDRLARRIEGLMHSPYMEVTTDSQDRGDRPDPVLPKLEDPDYQSFAYQHSDMHAPVPLIYSKGHFSLNGYPVSIEELQEMHDQVAKGRAKITYPNDLFKAEEHASIQPETDMERDYEFPDVKNLYAYKRFTETEPKGMHIFVRTDAVDKILEEQRGEATQNIQTAISHMVFNAASDGGVVYHLGRDSYYVFMPTYEDSAKFISKLEAIVENTPSIHAHHPYFDVGVSDDLEGAFDALHMTANFKIMNDSIGNHVVINTDHTFKYVSPSGT